MEVESKGVQINISHPESMVHFLKSVYDSDLKHFVKKFDQNKDWPQDIAEVASITTKHLRASGLEIIPGENHDHEAGETLSFEGKAHFVARALIDSAVRSLTDSFTSRKRNCEQYIRSTLFSGMVKSEPRGKFVDKWLIV